jgi:hypothetical protein
MCLGRLPSVLLLLLLVGCAPPEPPAKTAGVEQRTEDLRRRAKPPPKPRLPTGRSSAIVLDLEGDGIPIVDRGPTGRGSVFFDFDVLGLPEQSSWISGSDGFLVRDIDGDGDIDSGRELLGDQALKRDGSRASDGLEALIDLDSDSNGRIDRQDAAYLALRVWRDVDRDASIDNGELQTLDQLGIASLQAAPASAAQVQGVAAFTMDAGRILPMSEIVFETFPEVTRDPYAVQVPRDVAAMPDLGGQGNLRSLHQAMAQDQTGSVKALVRSWQTGSPSKRFEVVDELLFAMGGVGRMPRDARGSNIGDARRLAVLERIFAEEFRQPNGGIQRQGGRVDPAPNAGRVLESAFLMLRDRTAAVLYEQTDMPTALDKISVRLAVGASGVPSDKGELVVVVDTTAVAEALHRRFRSMSLPEAVLDLALFSAALRLNDAGKNETSALLDLRRQAVKYDGFFGRMLLSIGDISMKVGTSTTDRLKGDDEGGYVFGLGGNDVLTGGNGDDVLDGGAGDDVLEGGPGKDVYLYGTGYGHDSVKGARGKGLRGDHVLFGSGVEARYVEFGREGDDLRAVLQPSGGTLTIRDWYGNPANRVDWFELPDGRRLLEGDVDRLIEAQSLSQSPAGGTRSSLSGAGVASAPSELWKR